MLFEWDPDKAASNLRKHGVSFDEAAEVFLDREGIEEFDPAHSVEEPRYRRIGLSSQRLLLVVFIDRSEDVIRIISARKATGKEHKLYENQ